jgi:hypothetical protein
LIINRHLRVPWQRNKDIEIYFISDNYMLEQQAQITFKKKVYHQPKKNARKIYRKEVFILANCDGEAAWK